MKLIERVSGKSESEVRKGAEKEGYFLRIPFNSSRKRMTTGVKVGSSNYIFTSGASEKILDSCDYLYYSHNN